MTAQCTRCGKVFDSKDGGAVCTSCGDTFCPKCHEDNFVGDDPEGRCDDCAYSEAISDAQDKEAKTDYRNTYLRMLEALWG